MFPKWTYILPFLMLTVSLVGQNNQIELIINENGPSSIRLIDSSKIVNGHLTTTNVRLRDTIPLSDTIGGTIIFRDSCIAGAEYTFSLEFNTDTFSVSVINGAVINQNNDTIIDALAPGDTLGFGRTPTRLYMLRNSYTLDSIVFSVPSPLVSTDLSVISASNCHLAFGLGPVNILPDTSVQDTSLVEFQDTLMLVTEGESILPCIVKDGESVPTVSVSLANASPHFDDFYTKIIEVTSTVTCFNLSTDYPNGTNDQNREYVFELSAESINAVVGPHNRLHVIVVDDVQDSLTALCPGGILITAVDNNVNGVDRVSLTTIAPIYPNTSFSLANAVFEKTNGGGRWYASDSLKSPFVSSQEITYTGSSTLDPGTAICFDVPDGGSFLVGNFEINGITTNDFSVSNNGNNSTANINLSTDHPESLFLLQGTWKFNGEYADFFGAMLHGVQIGSDWLDDLNINPDFTSDTPEDIACYVANWGAELDVAAFYDCDGSVGVTSTFTVMSEISKTESWTFEVPTSALDLPSDICQQQCQIEELDTLWYVTVEDLVIPCDSNYVLAIDEWLVNHGNGIAFSSCGIESITNNYSGIQYTCGSSAFMEVIFTATDSCANAFADTATITIADDVPPEWMEYISPLILTCDEPTYIDSTVANWLNSINGVYDACGDVSISNDYSNQIALCGDSVQVIFTATDQCGNAASISSYILLEDQEAPVFVQYPQDLYLSCDGGYSISDTIDQWLNLFGHAEIYDNCHSSVEIIIEDSLPGIQCPVDTSILVTYVIQDRCNNVDSADAYIHIRGVSDTCVQGIALVQDSNTLVVQGFSCFGVASMQWSYQGPYDSIYQNVFVGEDTIFSPQRQGSYRLISQCHGECPDTQYIYYPVCDSLNMIIEDSAIGIKWGDLYYGSQPVSNYLISWVNSAGEEVFRSAAGSYFNDSTTLPHPLPVFQPTIPGNYVPIILESDFGTNLSCFDSVTVDPLVCGGDYRFYYGGAGGALAKHETVFTVGESTFLKIWLKTAYANPGNPDRLLVEYNGDTLYNSGFVYWRGPRFRLVQIPYKQGVSEVNVSIENQGNPLANTQYELRLKCCESATPCDSIELLPIEFNPFSGTNQPHICELTAKPDSTWSYQYFWDNYCMDLDALSNVGRLRLIGEYTSCVGLHSESAGCLDGDITMANLASVGYSQGAGFVINFSNSQRGYFQTFADRLQSHQNDSSAYVNIYFDKYLCSEDLSSRVHYRIIPLGATFTIDTVVNQLVFVISAVNPFDSSEQCFNDLSSRYNYIVNNHSFDASLSRAFKAIDSYSILNEDFRVLGPYITVGAKRFSNSACTLENVYSIRAKDYTCACETWYLEENDVIIDSSGLNTCPAADLQYYSEQMTENRTDYFSVYPNPTRGLINVDFDHPLDQDIVLEVFDLNGNLIKHLDFHAIEGINSAQIELDKEPVGIYMVLLRSSITTKNQRFILMR